MMDYRARDTMSAEGTELLLMGAAYLLAGLCLLLVGYLGWRKWRRRRHRHRHLRPRHQQHRRSWGSH
jgi:hypothetical protein